MARASDSKRRASDHVVAKKASAEEAGERRRTIGAASPATALATPSKHQVNLGSAAAQAYFFGDTPHSTSKAKTPHSISKRQKTPAKSPLPKLDETADMADISMLSAETTSTEESDMLNKSVLSDTTELTASNFVLQASSRQRLLELSRGGGPENVTPSNQEGNVHVQGTDKPQASKGLEPSESLENSQESNGNGVGQSGNVHEMATPAKPSPSLRSRLATSPSSLQKLTSSLRKAKQRSATELAAKPAIQESDGRSIVAESQSETTLRSAASRENKAVGVSFLLPPRSPAREKQSDDTTIEIETDKPLNDLLNNLNDPAQKPSSDSESTVTELVSPSSTIATSSTNCLTPNGVAKSSLRQSTPHPKKDGVQLDVERDQSVLSPSSSTKADDQSHFRLTSRSGTKLTPTKLSQSPRRVVNPESVDSPARNTRSSSAKKKVNANSPLKTALASEKADIDSNEESARETAGEKRSRDDIGDRGAETASLSIRNTAGRMSEITLSPSLSKMNKRRRSSLAVPPARADDESVHSTSTASTADLNMLVESLEPAKEIVMGVPGGMRNHHPSPATAEISIPRSILTSSKRKVPGSLQSRRSVVFGSPEAAEYRVGSPSVSLTPMPRGTAKAMFSMPAPGSQSSSSSSASRGLSEESYTEDKTVEMETDVGSFLLNLTTREETKADDSRNASAATQLTSGEDMEMRDNVNDPSSSLSSRSLPPFGQPEIEDETVELESNIEGLFASAFGSPNNGSMLHSTEKKDTKDLEASPAQSVDMADAQSIASIASSHDEKSDDGTSLEASSQKLNFEGKLAESSDDGVRTVATLSAAVRDAPNAVTGIRDDPEENTIELEADLTTLLSTGVAATMTREAPIPVTLTKKFSKMDSNLVPHTNRLSFGDALVQGNVSSQTDGAHDTFTEGSLTRELETNMASLLHLSSGAADTPSASRRRSSHRFSLTPNSRLSLTSDGDVVSKVSRALDTQDEENTDDFNNIVDESATNDLVEQEVMVELDNKELMDSAGLPETPSALNITDTLENANTNSEIFKHPLIAEAMSGFVSAVCGEVEMKAESSSDGNSCFSTLAEESPRELLEIQKALRSSDNSKVSRGKDELKRLAQAAQAFVEFEWNSWEVQVVDSLAKALDGLVGDFEESDERLMSSVTLADDALEAVSLIEGTAVRKARRRSMSRRKASSQALEVEISDLEQQIAREKATLVSLQEKQRERESEKAAVLDHLTLMEQIKPSRVQAESLQHRFLSLHGMHCWSPLVVDESNIVVGFIGASPKTCIKLCFAFDKHGTVTCQANVDPILFKQRRGKRLKLTPLITEFVVANIERLVESARNTKLKRGSDIPMFLQQMEMLHGRIEITASEVFGLQKRYGTLLEADPLGSKSSDFLLSVDFTSLSDSTTLRATFELTTSYPFAPLNICLDDREGKVDADLMRRQLVKNAKPGFGYLSRTCDTISAFLR